VDEHDVRLSSHLDPPFRARAAFAFMLSQSPSQRAHMVELTACGDPAVGQVG
jgi:hypothetical protein